MTEEPNDGEEKEDAEDYTPQRGGQSDPAPDHEESESDQDHKAGSKEVELPE